MSQKRPIIYLLLGLILTALAVVFGSGRWWILIGVAACGLVVLVVSITMLRASPLTRKKQPASVAKEALYAILAAAVVASSGGVFLHQFAKKGIPFDPGWMFVAVFGAFLMGIGIAFIPYARTTLVPHEQSIGNQGP